MSVLENITEKFKQFGPTTWSIKNKTAVYLLMLVVSGIGVYQFMTLPKEQFPDIVIPTIYVSTIYTGNSPKDMENLVTRPIEKQIKSITGAKIKKFTSTSQQDYSAIMVEFETDVKVDVALQKVKDAIDKSKQDLPTNLTQEPTALEVSFSDQPIMYVNISGDYDQQRLKKFADDMKDKLEDLPQLNRVDIVGAPEREFQINVDNYKMRSSNISFDDIDNAVKGENLDISGGLLDVGTMKRNLQLKGQFHTAQDIEQIIIRNPGGGAVYLKDIATIRDTIKDRESYARLDGKNVVTLNIIKRSGENLIETSDNVKGAVEEMKKSLPRDLTVVVTGDLSTKTRTSFDDLVNSIVIGFMLVLIILMFFMGVVNAFFVALSVPLSMFVAFMFLPGADVIIGTHVTLNFIVLFALLFGLGIIVDDAIVVIENTHRIFTQGKGKITAPTSAMMAAGEVFIPVLAGTVTTLAPFFPLLFWPGIIGKFMVYLPAMLIFTLTASLVVAFIMNPVFAVDFMNHPEEEGKSSKADIFKKPGFWIAVVLGVLLDLGHMTFLGNLLLFLVILTILNKFVFEGMIHSFQNRVLPWIMGHYESLLRWALKGWRPAWLLLGTFGLLIFSFMFFGARNVQVVFFPKGDPNQVYVYLKLPVGTNVDYTDSVTKVLEERVYRVLDMQNGKKNPVVESVISNVAIGASDPTSGDRSTRSELGRIQVSFVEYGKRNGVHTAPYLDSIRHVMKGIPGAEISVDQEQNGPPTDPPVNIEVASEDFDDLIKTAVSLKNYLDSVQTPGVEELKMDIDLTNPEISFTVDRQRAMTEGVSSAQIGQTLRTALFGRESSKIKEGKEEYKIQIRNLEVQRKNLIDLLNMNVTFRDMANQGRIKNVPISSLVKIDYTSTLGSVKRKNQKRVITLRSNVLNGYTPTAVNIDLAKSIGDFKKKPDNVNIKQTGEGEQQAETGAFLGKALVIALMTILIVLVLQFNSVAKSVIILTEILFSVIGVILGFAITKMEVSVIMTGLGIVGLAGIVVKNGILVIEFTDELRGRGMKTREAAIEAGKTRIIPVLLTAMAAILALIPLAVGFNINFVTLFSELNPHIYFGGDNAVFWKPLSWTIIFGLAFAFFMTLIMVPSMYIIAERLRRPMRRHWGGKWISFLGIPPFTVIFLLLMFVTILRHRFEKARRRRKLSGKVGEAWIGSWF
ncbi:efflux RND transporter permease subunit [Flavitalea sp. BT771]|uniref:efflux RND transporter permease subunit n=1 Tax=Flavitalea sp. BT771 TaxID=3063329 RepID=UPI0026E46F0D|nr:efflux RND transporter permease subunit [Flavitalea sp. BT771]MDO6433749.1 efflux RND transporter permease subunit [Flavitalea sp. BT771]MDV6222346.1 efflux RND transporter permease subunit [Flavitalea sp. BT771]